MNPPNREVAIFGAALELPLTERAAYLAQACVDDPSLRRRLEDLLRVHDEAIPFLEQPASGVREGAMDVEGAEGLLSIPSSPAAKAGDRIGRYKLLQQIGEGGCGVVYMAEQEEPVRRRVALKVIKLGMDTKQVIARFEAERQALALMDHPNIARVLDAGATDTGRPYFVMELVRGIKITDYCDQNNLPTTERLKLFIQVCRAIQHAHQKGIIHRDIKPSNILIASNDGVPVPKVIDFGVAKATQGRLTNQTVFTAFEQFIGTPAYMSPEQAALTMLDIDTRTDIYSLGVLLYELLTGKTPFEPKELLARGLDEMRRTIREKAPMRPSTRLSTMLAGELSTTAQRHHTEAPKLIHRLRGDLDWIAMKCLEKDRARRYETTNGLAMDIQRHLNCEPVLARPPSRLYELQKTVRRHKFGFLATAALITVLTAGVVISTHLLMMESKAYRRALSAEQAAESGRRAEANLRKRAELAETTATEELWHEYVARARAARFSGQPGRRFDSLEALAKAAAIRLAPELRDEAIACLALPDIRLERRLQVTSGVFDHALERYAMVATNRGNITIRRLKDDQELLLLPNPAGTVATVCGFSSSGNYLAAVCLDRRLQVWDLEHRKNVLTASCAGWIESVDFTPDDQCAVVGARGAEISLYELPAGKKVNSIPTPFPAAYVRYAPSGKELAISSPRDRRVVLLDPATGATLGVLTNGAGLGEVAWHPRNLSLAAAGKDGLIYLWDTVTGRLLHKLSGHQGEPGNVAFSRDGEILISTGWDGTHLWSARTGEHLLTDSKLLGAGQVFAPGDTAYGHWRYGEGLALELASFASGREARRWQARDEDTNSVLVSHSFTAFSPDGQWLAFGRGDVISLFDTRTGDLLATLPTGQTGGALFQKSGRGLVVSGERGLFLWPIHHVAGQDQLTIGPPAPVGEPGAWQQAGISDNGQVFAAFHGGYACTFEAEALRPLARTGFCGDPARFRFLSLSPDGRCLATSRAHDRKVTIWDPRTGTLVKELVDPEWGPRHSLNPIFEPQGHRLIIASEVNCRTWETNSWVPGLRVSRSDLSAMALSHQSKLMALREGRTSIQLRDTTTGDVVANLESPLHGFIMDLAFSPDDTQLAVTHSGRRELLVWDLRLLREELANLHLDWARPPFPAAAADSPPQVVHFSVLADAAGASGSPGDTMVLSPR